MTCGPHVPQVAARRPPRSVPHMAREVEGSGQDQTRGVGSRGVADLAKRPVVLSRHARVAALQFGAFSRLAADEDWLAASPLKRLRTAQPLAWATLATRQPDPWEPRSRNRNIWTARSFPALARPVRPGDSNWSLSAWANVTRERDGAGGKRSLTMSILTYG